MDILRDNCYANWGGIYQHSWNEGGDLGVMLYCDVWCWSWLQGQVHTYDEKMGVKYTNM